MTAPNLTPAEALDLLREDTLGSLLVSTVRRCVPALETLLSEHDATKAKLAAYEAKGDYHEEYRRVVAEHLKWERSVRDDDAAKLHKLMARQEPAAAVPSDEEIAKAIRKADSTRTPYAVGHLTEAVEMLAKRIGVKL